MERGPEPPALRPALLAWPAAACSVTFAAVLLVRPVLAGLSPAASLAIEVVMGAVVYVGTALLMFPTECREILDLARSALSSR